MWFIFSRATDATSLTQSWLSQGWLGAWHAAVLPKEHEHVRPSLYASRAVAAHDLALKKL